MNLRVQLALVLLTSNEMTCTTRCWQVMSTLRPSLASASTSLEEPKRADEQKLAAGFNPTEVMPPEETTGKEAIPPTEVMPTNLQPDGGPVCPEASSSNCDSDEPDAWFHETWSAWQTTVQD